MSIRVSLAVLSWSLRWPSKSRTWPPLCVTYRCERFMPAYLVGPNTTALDILRLKCNLERVAQIAEDCMCSHSDLVNNSAGRGNPTLGI
jgi:hypothetical protein